jgi:hypothetical protein
MAKETGWIAAVAAKAVDQLLVAMAAEAVDCCDGPPSGDGGYDDGGYSCW